MTQWGDASEVHSARRREALAKIVDENLKRHHSYVQYSVQYGQSAVRGVFIANGAAMVALLALLGNVYGKDRQSAALIASELYWPGVVFSLGLLLSIITSGAGYLNFGTIAGVVGNGKQITENILHERELESTFSKRELFVIAATQFGGPICIVLSMLMFIFGSFLSGAAIVHASARDMQRLEECRSMLDLSWEGYRLSYCERVQN